MITPFIYHVCLSQNFSYAKKTVWAMLKKEEKKNVHAKRHERKKCMPKSMKKRKEKERKGKRNKDSPYFQIKGSHSKRERFMI